MNIQKIITSSLSSILLSLLASYSQAAIINIDGKVTISNGSIAALAIIDTPFNGSLDWSTNLDSARIELAGLCFSTDTSGLPATSSGCDNLSVVPILASGQTAYDSNTAAPGTSFEQAGTTFDGNFGRLSMTSYFPSFATLILLDLDFNGDGTGNINLDAGNFGSTSGTFVYSQVPVPAACWLFGSSLLGLAASARKRRAA